MNTMNTTTHPMHSAALLLGRILLSGIFLMSGVHKITAWDETAGMMTEKGLPAVPLLLAASIAVELGGGACVLLGWCTRFGALLLFAFLIPVTGTMHNFWAFEGQEQMAQMMHFVKNITIMGGLMTLAGAGAGAWSVDQCCCAGKTATTRHSNQLAGVP